MNIQRIIFYGCVALAYFFMGFYYLSKDITTVLFLDLFFVIGIKYLTKSFVFLFQSESYSALITKK
jgi:hypothetical protein